jgi:protein-disulfide isomerase-like protein with CxxC motif
MLDGDPRCNPWCWNIYLTPKAQFCRQIFQHHGLHLGMLRSGATEPLEASRFTYVLTMQHHMVHI